VAPASRRHRTALPAHAYFIVIGEKVLEPVPCLHESRDLGRHGARRHVVRHEEEQRVVDDLLVDALQDRVLLPGIECAPS
jgi:hypothetical protein